MIRHETRIWVNYSDTDQMGFVHHSNYVKYYENARWDAFRCLGLPYSKIEEADVLMPVIEMDLKFLKPAFYDDELVIKNLNRT
jgi:acyl-CoA thioester hydrolase